MEDKEEEEEEEEEQVSYRHCHDDKSRDHGFSLSSHCQVTVKSLSSQVMSCHSHRMYKSILMSQSRHSQVRVKSLSSYNVTATGFK